MSLPSLLDPPILFAHRGGRAHANENTMAAFELGLRLGATGLESDAWLTADGVVVLDHHGRVRFGMRRRAIARCARAELPDHIPTLADLYATCGSAFHLSLDVKDKAGKVTTWSIECPPTNHLRAAGITRQALWNNAAQGEVVTVYASKAKNGKPIGLLMRVTYADGHFFHVRGDPKEIVASK